MKEAVTPHPSDAPAPPQPQVEVPFDLGRPPVIFPKPGEVITHERTGNSYTFQGQIGEGAFGVVFACTDSWGNELAAKVLKDAPGGKVAGAAAESEFSKLLQLRHPFITFVFDAFEFSNAFYIITERCADSLKGLFRLQPVNGHVWIPAIARCLLQAVHYLHFQNYVHQDIHLGNVLTALVADEMDPTSERVFQFKLGDLGIARLATEVNANNTFAQWMLPPEVINPTEFGPTDRRIDIYHLGLLFLQLAVSKELQFSREEILAGEPRKMALTLTAPFNFALEKALRRHVPYRTANAMELWRDLNTAVTG